MLESREGKISLSDASFPERQHQTSFPSFNQKYKYPLIRPIALNISSAPIGVNEGVTLTSHPLIFNLYESAEETAGAARATEAERVAVATVMHRVVIHFLDRLHVDDFIHCCSFLLFCSADLPQNKSFAFGSGNKSQRLWVRTFNAVSIPADPVE